MYLHNFVHSLTKHHEKEPPVFCSFLVKRLKIRYFIWLSLHNFGLVDVLIAKWFVRQCWWVLHERIRMEMWGKSFFLTGLCCFIYLIFFLFLLFLATLSLININAPRPTRICVLNFANSFSCDRSSAEISRCICMICFWERLITDCRCFTCSIIFLYLFGYSLMTSNSFVLGWLDLAEV